MPHLKQDRTLLFVTGMSGAGKTLALKILSEIGFDVIDNLPARMIETVLKDDEKHNIYMRAFGFGGRITDDELTAFSDIITRLKQDNIIKVILLFFDARDEVLIKRYAETGMSHPLSRKDTLDTSLKSERYGLSNMRANADLTIDTSDLHPRKLMDILLHTLSHSSEMKPTILISSFGYKYGTPHGTDLIFDARILKNPYWVEYLRDKTGQDTEVADYIFNDAKTKIFLEQIENYLTFSVIENPQDGKRLYHIAIGCTGGKHRSVYSAEKIKEFFIKNGFHAHVFHKNLSHDNAYAYNMIYEQKRYIK